jgi:hypothetical protein
VAGLNLNPPEQAIVLCMDENDPSRLWTAATHPFRSSAAGAATMTHDYKRNGTTTLFAALDVLTGQVIGQCLPRHRHEEFLAFKPKACPATHDQLRARPQPSPIPFKIETDH